MLLEDKIIHEIKKENFIRLRDQAVEDLMCEVIYVERRMLKEGYSREITNRFCRNLIQQHDEKFKRTLINENIFSKFFYGAVGMLAPGVVSYLKKKFIIMIFEKLGIDPNTVIGNFFANALKNVKFLELFGYFKEGKCSLVIETLMKAVVDSLIDYTVKELGKAAQAPVSAVAGGATDSDIEDFGANIDDDGDGFDHPASGMSNAIAEPPALTDSSKVPAIAEALIRQAAPKLANSFVLEEIAQDKSFVQKAGEALIRQGVPKEALSFFDTAGKKLKPDMMLEIIQDHIKRYLLPPLINTLTSFICDDLSFEESFKSFKDATDSETKKRLKSVDDLKKERRAKAFGSDEKPATGEIADEDA